MKILIVEDDHFFQKFYSTKLSSAGYQVEVASDGEEGLIKMATVKPDLVLLDLIMPKKDGFEVLEAVSQNPVLKTLPIIIFSTLGDEADVKRAMQLGAVDYINKSFHDIENLKSKINAKLPGHTVPTPPVASPVINSSPIASPPQSNGNTTGST